MADADTTPLTPALRATAAAVDAVILDVDGVMTDGRIVYTDDGRELKHFHVQDGAAVKLLLEHGYRVAIVTGRSSPAVARRAAELGVTALFQGVADKTAALEELRARHGWDPARVACIGDDVGDLELFQRVALSFCVPNGHPLAQRRASVVTRTPGGAGAVRELAQVLLTAADRWPWD